jgi:hypothetical protein
MTEAKIFLVGKNGGSLIPMTETDYVQEDILQTLLENYPDLLPGDQINPEAPRRWLLVAREIGVPGDVDEAGRWSLDHLFLDQDGIPTFVECKRASDTRIRREVVAQMLDYAANGVEYWSMDRLRQAATETARAQGLSLDDQVLQLIDSDDEADIEDYWQTVENNLKTGKVRLLFVADRTPKELRRLVEFLNEKMSDVEVLVVEIKQFVGTDGQQAMVPRVLGLTEAARQTKQSEGRKGRISREEFLANCTPEVATFLAQVLDLAQERGYEIYWGTIGFSVRLYVPAQGRLASFAYGWSSGVFEIFLRQLPLSEQKAQALRDKLLAFRVFEEAGVHTLRAKLDTATLEQMPAIYNFLLDAIPEALGWNEIPRWGKGKQSKKTNREEFLARYPEPIANFFRHVLELTEQTGYKINWGSQGFSARAYLPKTKQWASFAYGWTWGAFDFYFSQLPLPEAEASTLRKELLAFGIFKEAGEKTLRATLTDDITLAAMPKVYDFILETMSAIVQKY